MNTIQMIISSIQFNSMQMISIITCVYHKYNMGRIPPKICSKQNTNNNDNSPFLYSTFYFIFLHISISHTFNNEHISNHI